MLTMQHHMLQLVIPHSILMFGRDPRLPIDRLIELDETQGQEPSTWVTRHQKELRSAHRRVTEKLAKEAAIHKQKYDK